MSAVDVTTPQEAEVVEVVNETVGEARAIVVNTPVEAQAAVEFLSKIADAKKRSEKARRFLVDPMNAHVKTINERFKSNLAPLDEADQLVREKLLAFQQAEAAALAERQAVEDAARREREAAAEAERRRQAEEAARVEREAREAEERRQAQLREAANERAREIAAMNDGALLGLIHSGKDVELAQAEVAAREAKVEADARAADARRKAEEATQASIAAASAPAVSVAPTQLASASGSASARKRWTATVIDETLVPRQYLVVDQKALNAAVRAGEREIAGVKIEQVDELAVRAGR